MSKETRHAKRSRVMPNEAVSCGTEPVMPNEAVSC